MEKSASSLVHYSQNYPAISYNRLKQLHLTHSEVKPVSVTVKYFYLGLSIRNHQGAWMNTNPSDVVLLVPAWFKLQSRTIAYRPILGDGLGNLCEVETHAGILDCYMQNVSASRLLIGNNWKWTCKKFSMQTCLSLSMLMGLWCEILWYLLCDLFVPFLQICLVWRVFRRGFGQKWRPC